MPDNQPEKSPEFPTLKQAFWVAQNADLIVAHLLKEEGQSWKIAFQNPEAIERCSAILDHGKMTRNALPQPSMATLISNWNITPILSDFFDLTYPIDKPEQRKVPVMDWIANRYLTETHNDLPILGEDLYKIGEDVRYFTRLRDGGHIKGKTIEEHETLADLRETLKPFAENRAAKKAERLDRRMGADTKNEIMAGTTILHQGDLGRVVMVHTVKASQYWGNNTKWCISGDDMAAYTFPDYNSKGPILMFLPKAGQKEALVKRRFWVPEDKAFDVPSPQQTKLIDEMLRDHPGYATLFLNDLLPPLPTPAAEKKNEGLFQKVFQTVAHNIQGFNQSKPEEKPRFPSWKRNMIKRVQAGDLYWQDDEEACKDRDIVMAAVWCDGSNLRHADDSLRRDRDIILTAVHRSSHAARYALINIWKDRDFALTLARANPDAAPYRLMRDEEFFLDVVEKNPEVLKSVYAFDKRRRIFLQAIGRNPEALEFAEEKYRRNPHFIAKALSINPLVSLHLHKYDVALPDDKIILEAQLTALKTLVQAGKAEEADSFLRFVKPLWGQADRMFGDAAEQLPYLRTFAAESSPARPEARIA